MNPDENNALEQSDRLETALLYRLDAGTAKGDGIRRILDEMGVAMIDLTPEMLDQPVGVCAGLDSRTAQGGADSIPPSAETGAARDATAPEPTDDVLVMCGFSDTRISQLLSGIRAAGLPRVGLLATLTAHNRGWTLRSLIAELANERACIAAWMSLQQSVKVAETVLSDHPDLETPELARAIAAGRAILESREPPESAEAVRQADRALRAFMPVLPECNP